MSKYRKQQRDKLAIRGHALQTTWNGENGLESRTDATCLCGEWSMECMGRMEARDEYQKHLQVVEFSRGDCVKIDLASLWFNQAHAQHEHQEA